MAYRKNNENNHYVLFTANILSVGYRGGDYSKVEIHVWIQ